MRKKLIRNNPKQSVKFKNPEGHVRTKITLWVMKPVLFVCHMYILHCCTFFVRALLANDLMQGIASMLRHI